MTNRRPQGRVEMLTLGQLLAHRFPPRQHIVAPWLRQGESTLLWAPTGLGKTMAVLTIALMAAGGGKAMGWKTTTPRRVLLIDGEMHAEDLRDRLESLAQTVEGIDIEQASTNLWVASRQHQKESVKFPDIAKSEDQASVLAMAQKHRAELLILDNFSTLAEVADENEAAAMSPVLTFLLRLKQAGIACILVHHSGKTEGSYRGSSKLATTFENIIGLHRLDGHAVGDGVAFELRWGKFRGKPHGAIRDTEMVLDTTGDPPTWKTAPAANAERAALLDVVQSGECVSARAVAQKLGWDPSKVSRLKKQAIARGEITPAAWNACLQPDYDAGGSADF